MSLPVNPSGENAHTARVPASRCVCAKAGGRVAPTPEATRPGYFQ